MTMSLSGIFGDDPSEDIDRAHQLYQGYAEKGMGRLTAEEAEGKAALKDYYSEALGFGAPYREAGQSALQQYMGSLGMGGSQAQQTATDKFRASPGYQYALEQGQKATQRGMAARGMSGSGAEQRELARMGQGLASQEYGHYQSRLANLAGLGAQQSGQAAGYAYGTGGQLAGLGERAGLSQSNLYGQMGQAASQAELAKAMARQRQQSSMWGSIGQLGGALLGGPVGQKIAEKVF